MRGILNYQRSIIAKVAEPDAQQRILRTIDRLIAPKRRNESIVRRIRVHSIRVITGIIVLVTNDRAIWDATTVRLKSNLPVTGIGREKSQTRSLVTGGFDICAHLPGPVLIMTYRQKSLV